MFSAISAYFLSEGSNVHVYERTERDSAAFSLSPAIGLALAITVIAVLVIGISPSTVVNLARAAV